MNHILVPLIVAAIGSVYIFYASKRAEQPRKRLLTFQEHAAEIRDMINRCDDRTEWTALDMEIDWLEETWQGKISPAVLIEEIGRLYEKWHQRGRQLDSIRKTARNY